MPFPLRWGSKSSSNAQQQKPKAPTESDLVRKLVDSAISDLDRRPLKSGVRVAVFVEGRLRYGFRNGFLHRCQGRRLADIEAAAASAAAAATATATTATATTTATGTAEEEDEELQLLKGVLVRFRDEKAFEDLLLEVSTAMKSDHLSSALSSLLLQFAQPSWMRWSSETPPVEVEGSTADLAKLLWAACFEREETPIRESMYDWSKDDLSTGWVIVHRVSPGIKERVAAFDKNLQQRPKATNANAAATSHEAVVRDEEEEGEETALEETWVSLLIQDLCKTAEGFQETIANFTGPGHDPGLDGVALGDGEGEGDGDVGTSCASGTAAGEGASSSGCSSSAAAAAAVPTAASGTSTSPASGERSTPQRRITVTVGKAGAAGGGGGGGGGARADSSSGAARSATASSGAAGAVGPRAGQGPTGESPGGQVAGEGRRSSYPSSANDFL